jgi:nitrite reductase/ring-hydroxylating ferredoxin subunit
MAAQSLESITRVVQTGMGGERTLDGLAETVQGWLNQAVQGGGPSVQQAKDFLNGVWLGHPLHPALTDVPLGAWTAGVVLVLLGAERPADWGVGIGNAAPGPTHAAGVADWSDTSGTQRRVGMIHGLLNPVGLGCMVGSLLARRAGSRPLGIGLSTAGYVVGAFSAWLGGELVFSQGTGVSRNAFDPVAEDFQVAARASDLPEGRLARGEITVEGQTLPLVLLKRGGEVLALSAVCSHWGGPLDEGTLEGEVVQCPWHGSRFSLRDGSVQQGPAAFAQPCFEARIRGENVEVRRTR